MNLRQLRYFIAVAEHLNFGAAARSMHVAQPALSRQIRALEDQVGGPLFERDRRHVALTPLGLIFLDEARATERRAQQALHTGQRAARGELGKLSIGFSSASIFHPLLADAMHAFRHAAPAVEMHLEEIGMALHFEAVRKGRVDLSFIHLDPGDLDARQRKEEAFLRLHVVADERLVLAVGEQHPAARQESVTLAQMTELDFLALPAQLMLAAGGPFARLSQLRGQPVRIVQEVQSVTAMIHLAAAGIGAAIVPASMTCIHSPRVRYLPIAGELERRLLLLVQPVLATPWALRFIDSLQRLEQPSA